MSMKVITDGELDHLSKTLEAVVEEFDAIDETTDHVFTTGAPDMIREAFELITALREYETPTTYDHVPPFDSEGC